MSNDHRYFIISDIIFYTHSWDLKKKRVIRGKCLFYGLYLRHLMLFPAFAFFFKNIVLYTFHLRDGHLRFLNFLFQHFLLKLSDLWWAVNTFPSVAINVRFNYVYIFFRQTTIASWCSFVTDLDPLICYTIKTKKSTISILFKSIYNH